VTEICVIIPAFNEADRLRALLPSIPRYLHGHPVRTIVASDGSTDATELAAVEAGAALVSLPTNRGKGAALRAGLAEALGTDAAWLVTMDGDGQHDPSSLEPLVAPVVRGECDVSIGSRYLGDPGRGPTPLNRYLVRRATVTLLRRVLRRHHSDPYSGYRCFSREALERIEWRGDGYGCELEQLFEVATHGLRVREVPIARRYGPGSTKMGARRGRLLGRLAVLWQYASTIGRRTRELRRTRLAAAVSATPVPVGADRGLRP
jgi:glycosyltransferase involved in cell wall biosynthesis